MDVRTGSPVSTMTEAGLRTRGDQGRGVLAHPHRQVEAKSQRPAYAVTHRSVRPTLTLQGRVQRCETPAEVSEPRIVPLVLWCKGAGEPRTGGGGGSPKYFIRLLSAGMVENASEDYPVSCGMNSEPTLRVEVKRTSSVGRWESAIELKGIDLENNNDYYFETFTVTLKLIVSPEFWFYLHARQVLHHRVNPYFLLHIIRQTRTLLFLTSLAAEQPCTMSLLQ